MGMVGGLGKIVLIALIWPVSYTLWPKKVERAES
jgi:TctA family transporter